MWLHHTEYIYPAVFPFLPSEKHQSSAKSASHALIMCTTSKHLLLNILRRLCRSCVNIVIKTSLILVWESKSLRDPMQILLLALGSLLHTKLNLKVEIGLIKRTQFKKMDKDILFGPRNSPRCYQITTCC